MYAGATFAFLPGVPKPFSVWRAITVTGDLRLPAIGPMENSTGRCNQGGFRKRISGFAMGSEVDYLMVTEVYIFLCYIVEGTLCERHLDDTEEPAKIPGEGCSFGPSPP
jgi:hypothetical protein